MLEIVGIILLSYKNRANAVKRGQKPGKYVFLTIALWIGFEFIGAMIGAVMGFDAGVYLFAIAFALIGGAISYNLAKNCKQGDYVPQAQKTTEHILQNAEMLSSPTQIFLVREKSVISSLVRWDFELNGQTIGSLKNGESLIAITNQRQNIIRAIDSYGNEVLPYIFDVNAGGRAEIHFKVNKFLPELSKGILDMTGDHTINSQPTIDKAQVEQPSFTTKKKGPGVLLVRFDIEKLNELSGSYGFQSGRLIGQAVPPSLLEGMTISDGDSAATLSGRDYVCLVAITSMFNRAVLEEEVEPLIKENEEIKKYGAPPITQILSHTDEPLVIDGVVRNGKIDGPGGWCARGFMSAWEEYNK